jgi:hypothetical protein
MYVYLIKCSIFYKIGFSKNPKSRLQTIKTHNPLNVKLLATLKTENYLKVEKELHVLFLNKNSKREWFELNEDDLLKLKIEYAFNFTTPINSIKTSDSEKKHDFSEIKEIRIDNNKIDYFKSYFEDLFNVTINDLKEIKRCCIKFDSDTIKQSIDSLYSQESTAQQSYNLLFKVCSNKKQMNDNPTQQVLKIISAIIYKQYKRSLDDEDFQYIHQNYMTNIDHDSVIKDLNTKKFYFRFDDFVNYIINKYTI